MPDHTLADRVGKGGKGGQNFGPNIVIGSSPMGGQSMGGSEEEDKAIDRLLGGKAREKTLATNITSGQDGGQDDSGGTTLTTQTDTPPDDKTDDRDTGVTEKDGKKNYFIKGIGEVDAKLYGAYRQLIAAGVPLNDVLKAIDLGIKEKDFADRNLKQLSDMNPLDFSLVNLIKSAFNKPSYEHEFLGSAGAAAILNKMNQITDPKKKQEYVKQIIDANPEGFADMFADKLGLKGGKGNYDPKNLPTPEEFEKQLVGFNIGNKNFDKNYYGTRADFYKVNPFPQTSGGIDELAGLAFGEDEFLNRQIDEARRLKNQMNTGGGGIAQGSGGGGGGSQQNQDTSTGTTPDYGLVRQFRQDEGFTPNYTGGPEQIMLAGGYFNPSTQQFMYGGGPYGTSSLFQGDPMQFFNKGGFVDGRGLSGFKMKGF